MTRGRLYTFVPITPAEGNMKVYTTLASKYERLNDQVMACNEDSFSLQLRLQMHSVSFASGNF
jgi:hypothetical protein